MNGNVNHPHLRTVGPDATRAESGEREALERVFACNLAKFHRIAYRILHNSEDAEDAVQEALFSAFRNIDKFEGRSQFLTWLTRIVFNSALMQLRRKRSDIEVAKECQTAGAGDYNPSDKLFDSHPDPEELYARKEILEVLNKSINQMPAKNRAVVALCAIREMRLQEASKALNLSLSAVKSRLNRGRRILEENVRCALSHSRPKLAPEMGDHLR